MVSADHPGRQASEQRYPPNLRPPGAQRHERQSRRRYRWIPLVLFLLLLSGAGVVWVLPHFVAQAPSVPYPEKTDEAAPPIGSQADNTAVRHQAEQTLQQFLHLQAALERDHAAVWAAQDWQKALLSARQGDRQFGERRFEQAAQAYARALAALQALQLSRADRLQQALDAGRRALSDNQAVAAGQAFQRALAIEPEHAGAQQGLARARARPAVLEQMTIAETAEQAGDWAAALQAYQAAEALDPLYAPAVASVERARRQHKLQVFNTAMVEALAALDRGRFKPAERALQQAAAVDPQAPALQDARRRLAAARQQAALADLRRSAAIATRSEDWQKALTLYQQALKIDANAGFARRGREQAQQRAALNRQFDHYLQDPERLYSPEPLANAGRLLAQVTQVPDGEPLLAGKRQRLIQLTREARQPLKVQLRSDGETEVVIYHVGRLGRFTDRQLELRPGIYTAVGSRPGYRDVRHQFRVHPGQPPVVIDIYCDEPISPRDIESGKNLSHHSGESRNPGGLLGLHGFRLSPE